MLKQQLLDKFFHLPLAQKAALLCSSLCLCSLIIIILAGFHNNRLIIHQGNELYGDSLIKQFAIDASNPLVQGDQLSLQSLLKKLVKSPLVMSASIYDIANKPLAEAGTDQASGQSISASITFQDSIAGYAVITLDTKPLQQHSNLLSWQLFLLALLLSALTYILMLLASRHISTVINDLSAIASVPAEKRKANTQINYPGKDEIKNLAHHVINVSHHQLDKTSSSLIISTPSLGCAVISFNLVNLEVLRETLSANQLQQSLTIFERQLFMISKLYGGEISITGPSSLCIFFRSTGDQQKENYPFRALCSGYLMMLWQQKQPSDIIIKAGLTMNSQLLTASNSRDIGYQFLTKKLITQASDIAYVNQHLVIENTLQQHPSVKNKVTTSAISMPNKSISDDVLQVEKLSENYEKVLQQQLLTLQSELER